ncbi:splicing factor 3B subunit 1 isoform X6 [Anguilla anguilla]|uniref:splicing factor 3B subunit 1 isoform X6 n=1 Tax=Anguilla anguilla TaxID=7936 RepID=UPI0015AB03BE|nr:splicing factor 3B subunit 1 isoform X6 [Anguilla anguilla]
MAKIAKTHEDIEAQILEIQGMKAALLEEGEKGVGLDSTGYYDQEIYGGSDSRFDGYVTSIAANEQEDDDEEDSSTSLLGQKKAGYHGPVAMLNAVPQSDEQYDPFAEHRPQKIADREDEYKGRRRVLIISPERLDPFADAVLLCQSWLRSLMSSSSSCVGYGQRSLKRAFQCSVRAPLPRRRGRGQGPLVTSLATAKLRPPSLLGSEFKEQCSKRTDFFL